jgi:hypothetical protein
MKPLIFILLAAISVQAQSLADVARKERERQAKVNSTRVITMDRSGSAVVATENAKPPAPASSAKPVSPPVVSPPVDPAKKRADDLAKLRIRIQQLQDQDTALQLEINEITNQVFAPVTDANAQAAAQTKLTDARQRLEAVRLELTTSRAILQQTEAQEPAK